ncbi:MAG: ribosome small subunit-dependent GTPase A [Bacteroidota bacterium]|nr:ribosome small subunit-dependent GTPase A [Bacteroidota bacterium]
MIKEGIVYYSTGSNYKVKSEDIFYKCKVKGKFRIKQIKTTNPIAVGDVVFFTIEKSEEKKTGLIFQVKKRKNYIIRKSVNLSKQFHIIASNIDQVFLLVTIKEPKTFTSFIDRFLITAEAYKIEVIILFNKIDLYSSNEKKSLEDLREIYTKIGYNCFEVIARERNTLKSIENLMKNKVSMFSGNSGVGKSTLLNTLFPKLKLKTIEISKIHKQGKHATTFSEMHDLNGGIKIIDTPGIKSFGVVDIDPKELGDYFPEFFALKKNCRFNNCLHIKEPKCAIKSALESNVISKTRYESYLSLMKEDDNYIR